MEKDQTKEEKPIEIDVLQCPNCKSYDTLIGPLGEQAVVDALLPPTALMFAGTLTGQCPPKSIMDRLPMGTKATLYMIGIDVCAKCYTVYARKIVLRTATKHPVIVKPQIILPKDYNRENKN